MNSLIQILKIDKYDNTREVLEQFYLPSENVENKINNLLEEKYDKISAGKGRVSKKDGTMGFTFHYSGGDAIMYVFKEYTGGESKEWEYNVLTKIDGVGTGLFEPIDSNYLKNK